MIPIKNKKIIAFAFGLTALMMNTAIAGNKKVYQEGNENKSVAVEFENGQYTGEKTQNTSNLNEALEMGKKGASLVCGNSIAKAGVGIAASIFTMGVGGAIVEKGCEKMNEPAVTVTKQEPTKEKDGMKKVSGKKKIEPKERQSIEGDTASKEVEETKQDTGFFSNIGGSLTSIKDKLITRSESEKEKPSQDRGFGF